MTILHNLSTNPQVAVSAAGYAVGAGTGGAATGARGTNSTLNNGTYYAATWTTATTTVGGGVYLPAAAVTAGVTYKVAVYVQSSVTQRLGIAAGWSTGATTVGTSQVVDAGVWTRMDGNFTAPASATSVTFSVGSNTGTSAVNWAVGNSLAVTGVLITEGIGYWDFFDGSTNPGFTSWDGAVGLSTSTAYLPNFEVNPFLNDAPCPRVEVVVSDLPPLVVTATLFRLAEGRTYPVRNAINVQAVGGFARLDHEVPFGVATTYSVEGFDADGDRIGFIASTATSAPFTLNVPDTWFHNPLDPSGAVKADLRGDALRDLSRPAQATTFYPQGRSSGIVVSSGRRALIGVNISAVTDTLEQADRMQALLGDGSNMSVPVVCLRIGANDRARIPHTLFVAILDQREQDIDYVYGGETISWEMTGDEVSPPVPGLVTSGYTLADLDASFTSLAAIDAAHLTLLDIDRDYGLAGAA